MKAFIPLLLVLFMSKAAQAAFIPFGVQNDVDVNTVLNNWGWEIVYQEDYGASGFGSGTPISTIFNGLSASDIVMFAALRDGATSFEVLGAGLFSAITTVTQTNQTNLVNGVNWYYNSLSMGFAGAGDTIRQGSADTNSTNARLRLSWHTTAVAGRTGGIAPDAMWGGWRAGAFTSLNNSIEWDKVILRYTGNDRDVPEPSSLGLAALMLLMVRRFARK